jgi:hypothetical protein
MVTFVRCLAALARNPNEQAALLAALLILAVHVAPAEAVYKGKCEHWLKAADAAQARGDKKGMDLALKHYSGCTGFAEYGAAIITAMGIGLSSYGHSGNGHGHSHNNH